MVWSSLLGWMKGNEGRKRDRQRRTARLGVEVMEQRLVPATGMYLTVNTLADFGGLYDGHSFSLRQAIEFANTGGANAPYYLYPPWKATDALVGFQIALDPHLSNSSATIELNSPLVVTNSWPIYINSLSNGHLTLSGKNSVHALDVMGGANLTISNVTITNGHSDAPGGAVRNFGNLTLNSVQVTNNTTTSYGGGIASDHGTLSVTDSTFSGNRSSRGGAVDSVDGAVTIANSTLSDNAASNLGGAINITRSTLTLDGVSLNDNVASTYGGGVHSEHGAITVLDTTFADNRAAGGGGIAVEFGTAAILNATFSGNSGLAVGGAVMASGAKVEVTNSTLTRNRANPSDQTSPNGLPLVGGGIFQTSSDVTLNNTIVAGNFTGSGTTASDVHGAYTGARNLVDGRLDGNLAITYAASDILSPSLADNGGRNLTHMIVSNGPARDTGDDAVAAAAGLTKDQRDKRRNYGRVDIGAVEWGGVAVLTVNSLYGGELQSHGGGFLSLREAIQVANSGTEAAIGRDARFLIEGEPAAGSTIIFDPSLFQEWDGWQVGTVSLTSPLVLTSPHTTTIIGPEGNYALLNISGENSTRVFEVAQGATVVLQGFTIANGNSADAPGGGILNRGNLTLGSVWVKDNRTTNAGGGIYSENGTLTVHDGVFTGNRAATGGAAKVLGGTASISASTIYDNWATGPGGAVALTDALLTLDAVWVNGNTSANAGGGVMSSGGSLTVRNTTFSGNRATEGGAVALLSGTGTIANSTFSGNSATGSGGALLKYGDATARLTNVTVTQNRADADGNGGTGGGLYVLGGELTLNNAIVTGNFVGTGADASDVFGNYGGARNLVAGRLDDDLDVYSSDQILNPTLNFFGGYAPTHIPVGPAVNAGSNAAANNAGLIADQRGATRIVDGLVDIGAVEIQASGGVAGGADDPPVVFQPYAPSDISLDDKHVAENRPVGTIAGAFSTVDLNQGDTFTYRLVNGTGDADNSLFSIDENGTLRTAAAFDFETKNSYSIRVRSTDSSGMFIEKFFTVGIANVNESPTAIALSNASVDENRPADTIVGVLSTTDEDVGDPHTYSLVSSGVGAGNNSSFTIDGHLLRTTESFDAEAGTLKFILIRSTDSAGQSVDRYFQIGVNNVNEAPTAISLSKNSLPENQPAGTVIGTFGTTDPDANQTFTYELVDGGPFTIVGNQLKTSVAFDFESQSSYSIRVRSTDGDGLSVVKGFTIAVTDVAENAAPSASVSGPAAGVRFQPLSFTVAATDADAGDTAFAYSINWGDGTPLQTLSAGQLASATHEYAASGNYAVSVTATDAHGAASGTATHAVTISAAALIADPLHPGQKALYVGGSAGNDAIDIDRTKKDRYEVKIETENGRRPVKSAQTFDGPISRVVAFGGDGDDLIAVSDNLKADAWLFGGNGDDALVGGGGNDILSGGAGNDLLTARGGRDILLGGTGSDHLAAGGGGDLLIAGTTAFDLDEIALSGIQVEWNADRDIAARVARLRKVLKASGPDATVFDDGAADILSGGSGKDWVFGNKTGGVRDRVIGGNDLFDELA